MDRLPAAFSKRPLVSSRWSEHPSAPRWPLALLAMVSTHTTTSTTITTHLSMASTLAVAEAAADELLHIGEPRSTIVSPTAYARSAYSRMPVRHTPVCRSCTIVCTGFGPSSTRSCWTTILWFSHRSYGDLLGGVGWSQQPLRQSQDHGYGAKRDGHAGTGMCFKLTAHYSFSVGDDGDRAVTRTPVSTTHMPVGVAKLALLSIPCASPVTTGIPGPE